MLTLVLLLGLAAAVDLLRHRIPNELVVFGLILACGAPLLLGGPEPAARALLGLLTALLLLLPLYLGRGMGAGDVKLAAVAGALVGPQAALLGLLYSFAFGLVGGLMLLAARGEVRAFLRRYGAMAGTIWRNGRLQYLGPAPGEAATLRFPYAFALAGGFLMAALVAGPTGGSAWLP